MKRFNKSSPWLKALVLLLLVLLVSGTTGKCRAVREGFIQEEKFISKSGPTIYDGFYSKIYDDLVHDKVKNEYEIGKIINTTRPTHASFILDVGSGTSGSCVERDIMRSVWIYHRPWSIYPRRSTRTQHLRLEARLTSCYFLPPLSRIYCASTSRSTILKGSNSSSKTAMTGCSLVGILFCIW